MCSPFLVGLVIIYFLNSIIFMGDVPMMERQGNIFTPSSSPSSPVPRLPAKRRRLLKAIPFQVTATF
jgi:amino acid transporter